MKVASLKTKIIKSIESKVVLSSIEVRKKVLAIPLVAASEKGRAQTIRVYMNGVVGQKRHLVEESHKLV